MIVVLTEGSVNFTVAVVRPYRGVSADDRRADRRERLIEAALDVAGEAGVTAVTMKAVCARAGLTERYYYESFRTRDELLAAAAAPGMQEIGRRVVAAIDATPPDLFARSRACAEAIVSVLAEDPRKARIFREAVANDALRAQHAAAINAYAALVGGQIRNLQGLGDEHQGRIDTVALILVGGTTQALGSWLDGSLELGRDELLDEVARMVVAAAGTIAP